MPNLNKIIIFLMVTLIYGCYNFVSTSPLISQKSEYFENEYFEILYPKDWLVISDPMKLGMETNYRFCNIRPYSYNIVIFVQKNYDKAKEILTGGFNVNYSSITNENFKERGIGNLSYNRHPIIFDGKRGWEIVAKGKSSGITEEDRIIIVATDSGFVGIISIYCKGNLTKRTQERLNSVINSIRFKEINL